MAEQNEITQRPKLPIAFKIAEDISTQCYKEYSQGQILHLVKQIVH